MLDCQLFVSLYDCKSIKLTAAGDRFNTVYLWDDISNLYCYNQYQFLGGLL